MKYFIISLLLLASATLSAETERIFALLDQPSYVAGERMNVAVTIEPATADTNTMLSRVAYVELCDEKHVCAQAMVALTEGFGWASIPLPSSLHSGNYLLTAYTTSILGQPDAQPYCHLVPVVNPQRTQRSDRVSFSQVSFDLVEGHKTEEQCPALTAVPSAPLMLTWPTAAREARLASLSVIGHPLWPAASTDSTSPILSVFSTLSQEDKMPLPRIEAEGHQVHARVVGNHQINQCMLAAVGKAVHLYPGQRQPDDTWIFYTDGALTGSLGVAITATDQEVRTIPMDIISPYHRMIPRELPALEMEAKSEDLRRRSIAAQQIQAISSAQQRDTLIEDNTFLGMEPSYDYNMEEWAKFSTIREIITEFVHGAHRGRDGHKTCLFIFDKDANSVSTNPALVLLDGVPVYDIDKLLNYDARLLEHVRIYPGRISLGNLVFFGVISFTTQRGGLSNYRLDAGTLLATYAFPQQRPSLLQYEGQSAGCLGWQPGVAPQQPIQLTAPSQPGTYTLLWQWVDVDGMVKTESKILSVLKQ